MGKSYSVEEVEKDVDKFKRDVLEFNGTILSKRYGRLQKQLILANAKILNVKKTSAYRVQGVCDQLLKELNEYLEILTAKIINKDGYEYEDRELEEERDFIKHPRENDAQVIISLIEKEISSVEYEVENIKEAKDSARKDLLKSELETYFKELVLTKTEQETSLDVRENKIIQRVVSCYKQLINVEGKEQNQSVIVTRQQHAGYINALMDYLKETGDLVEQKCDSQTSKINPPVPNKTPIAQKNLFQIKK